MNKVLKEIYIGMAMFVACFLLIGIFFMRPYWLYAVSLLVGGVAAGALLYHVYDCLDKAFSMNQKGAQNFVTIRSLLRLVIRAALLVGSILIHWSCFVGIVIGLLSPKVSAYFNPQIKWVLNKIEKNKACDMDNFEKK